MGCKDLKLLHILQSTKKKCRILQSLGSDCAKVIRGCCGRGPSPCVACSSGGHAQFDCVS